MEVMQDQYEFDVSNAEATVVRYVGDLQAEHVQVPECLGGVPVAAIAANSFRDATMMRTVAFPDSLQRLERDALAGCDALIEIVLPGTVEFSGLQFECPNLRCVVINGTEVSPAGLLSLSILNGVGIVQHYNKDGVEAWIDLELRAICG